MKRTAEDELIERFASDPGPREVPRDDRAERIGRLVGGIKGTARLGTSRERSLSEPLRTVSGEPLKGESGPVSGHQSGLTKEKPRSPFYAKPPASPTANRASFAYAPIVSRQAQLNRISDAIAPPEAVPPAVSGLEGAFNAQPISGQHPGAKLSDLFDAMDRITVIHQALAGGQAPMGPQSSPPEGQAHGSYLHQIARNTEVTAKGFHRFAFGGGDLARMGVTPMEIHQVRTSGAGRGGAMGKVIQALEELMAESGAFPLHTAMSNGYLPSR
jgi:hypothetical protein